jgi:hypothetical protein
MVDCVKFKLTVCWFSFFFFHFSTMWALFCFGKKIRTEKKNPTFNPFFGSAASLFLMPKRGRNM